MATKRQTTKAGGRKRKAARRGTGARQRRPAQQSARTTSRQRRPARPGGARSGARQARRDEAAFELERTGPRLVAADPDELSTASDQEAGQAWTLDTEGVPSFAREASGEGGPDGGPAVPTGREEGAWGAGQGAASRERAAREAGAELARWREQVDAARRAEAERDLPGFTEIGLEIALGALRLARTILTAPLRIALAFLRPI